jgi:hypothetical protein
VGNVFSEKLLHPSGPNCLKYKNDNLNNFGTLYTDFLLPHSPAAGCAAGERLSS